jgi:hypothetical protein
MWEKNESVIFILYSIILQLLSLCATLKDTAREILRGAPGVTIIDDRASNRFPTPLEVF